MTRVLAAMGLLALGVALLLAVRLLATRAARPDVDAETDEEWGDRQW